MAIKRAPPKFVQKRLSLKETPAAAAEGERATYTFVASDGAEDRVGDTVNPDGWKLDGFKANPVILFQHDDDQPVGKATDVRIEGGELIVDVQFGTTAKAQEIEQLVKDGVLSAVSVRITGIEWNWNDETGGIDFKSQELYEVSIVSVPCNPRALRVKSLKGTPEEAKSVASALKTLEEAYGPGAWLPSGEEPATAEPPPVPASDAAPAAVPAPVPDEPKALTDEEKSTLTSKAAAEAIRLLTQAERR